MRKLKGGDYVKIGQSSGELYGRIWGQPNEDGEVFVFDRRGNPYLLSVDLLDYAGMPSINYV